jgi:LmbE family N-acetylglucosaminyl deacetylase
MGAEYGIIAPMRWIYLSPHLDDAALSAGGFLFEQTQAGIPVEIWNIVCGFPPPGELTPFAQVFHYQWGTGSAEETITLRRAEDEQAARILGANTVNLDIPDCIYRRGPDGEPLYLDIYVQPHPAEAQLPGQIAQLVASRLQPDDRVICQLGVGGHIDHILVRQAAERLGCPLWYAADLPYLFKQPAELDPLVAGMEEFKYSITEAGLQVWVEAVLAYESQLSSLFDRGKGVDEEIRDHYAERGGFSLWQNSSKVT